MNGGLVAAILALVMTASSVFAESKPSFAEDKLVRCLGERCDEQAPASAAAHVKRPRPWPLPVLYGSSAFLQGFDACVTLRALQAGHSERNPVLKPITGHPLAFVAVKAGVTAGSIMVAERLWRDHHRTGAVLMMIASNGMMAVVAAHNSAVLQRVR